jgi:tRNA A-37 threonylcarbamoyl transferase component Bud32
VADVDSIAPETVIERVGQLIAGKYRVVRLIGSGGMGSVYEAENTAIGKRVALKFLHMSAQRDETSLARFHREARAISAVESAHIVQVFDWGQDDKGQAFLVMELLEGKDLGERIQLLGRIPVADAVRYTVEALRGLRKVHAAGIVHRDLKPENLFLVTGDDDQLHVKIVDFGLSKLIAVSELDAAGAGFDRSVRLTQAGAVVGTPLYMSPEQVEAVVALDHRADIWAMGAILYEMLAGAPPFMDRSYARLVMAICQHEPPDLSKINPEVPPELARVVAHALCKDREARLQHADAFIGALSQCGAVDVGRSGAAVPPAVPPGVVTRTLPSSDGVAPPQRNPAAQAPAQVQVTPAPVAQGTLPSLAPSPGSPAGASPADGGPLDATIAAHTKGAATMWLVDAPVFSIWRGEVDSPDRLRIEARDGSVRDLRLEPFGKLTLGRVKQVGDEVNDLVYPDVASRLAARLRHDGVRWWIERREECSVPVQVGTRSLQRGEETPLVHGAFVTVGAMRATMVDRRYVSRTVSAGTVDQHSGLLARAGLEQEVATALQHEGPFGLLLVMLRSELTNTGATALGLPLGAPGDASPRPATYPRSVHAAVAVHRAWPSAVVARDGDVVALIVRGDDATCAAEAARMLATARATGAEALACGFWTLQGEAANAGSEVELALGAIEAVAGPNPKSDAAVAALRDHRPQNHLQRPQTVLERARQPKNQLLLFGIEEQAALARIGPKVVGALEHELAAIISTQVGPAAMVTRLAPGIIGACLPRKLDAPGVGVAVQCEWHARPPITDGKVELPRTLSWEEAIGDRAEQRAQELSRECADAHGVLSALSGGLPYPIAGRVHAAIGASSAIERVKMLFDVLEGTWRFIAVVLAAAYFSRAGGEEGGSAEDADQTQLRAFFERQKTRAGLPLGAWRELARLAAKGFSAQKDPIGVLARQLLDVKLTPNQTFDTLSNLLHSERNNFAHGHYNEARAAADLTEFEQMTRAFLRALRPLAAWTLVTVQRTEPDLYGESQTVEFIDHTGPYATGARRRIGFQSPMRLANVAYLARWRDGLVLPLEPWIRRIASEERFDLYWIDHLPRPGNCNYSGVVSGQGLQSPIDVRRLPPLLRGLLS